jgi:hypothetical protein
VYHSSGKRSRREQQRLGAVEIVCILVAVAAVIGLLVWVITQAGGGALMT